jgi:hypothetical protein
MNLTLCRVLKSVEKKSVQSSCYGLEVMKNSHSKESVHCFMYSGVQPWLIKDMIALQNYTKSESVLVGPYGEIYPASHDANQDVNIKAEEVSDTQEEANPVGITNQEIKVEPEVSCLFLYVHS